MVHSGAAPIVTLNFSASDRTSDALAPTINKIIIARQSIKMSVGQMALYVAVLACVSLLPLLYCQYTPTGPSTCHINRVK